MIDNVKNWFKPLTKQHVLWGIGGILLILVMVGYVRGYKPTDIFLIGKSGTLTLDLPLSETNVFIDEEKKLTTTQDNEPVEFLLSPKRHSVIISRDGYYPWTKEIVIPSKGIVKLSPIFITINTSGQIITKNDPEYTKLRRTVIEAPVPTKDKPKISKDGSAVLWMDDNEIIVTIASTTYSVIQPDTAIRSVDFYRDRGDVVIFSTSNAIYAIEIDKAGKQNFMPIYKGISPTFYKNDPDFVYVWDNGTLMEVII